jgi:hypothetical protein
MPKYIELSAEEEISTNELIGQGPAPYATSEPETQKEER